MKERLLKRFIFSDHVEEGELDPEESEDLEALLSEGLLKREKGLLKLTTQGMREITFLQDDTAKRVRQPLLAVFAVVRKGEKVLLNRRMKQPFLGYIGFPGGKLEFGETLAQCMKKELEEETGLVARSQRLVAMSSTRSFDSPENEMAGHNVMFFFEVDDFDGELLDKTREGENFWAEMGKIVELSPIYPDILHVLDALDGKGPVFIEMDRLKGEEIMEGKVLEDYFSWRS